MMRSFLSRGRQAKRTPDEGPTPGTSGLPAIPKVLRTKVNRRLEQLADEQEQEKLTSQDSSGESENSLLQEESYSSDDDDESDNDQYKRHNNDISRRTQATITQKPTLLNQEAADESARLLRAIGSDLSETGTSYFEEDGSESSSHAPDALQSTSMRSPSSMLVMESQTTGNDTYTLANRRSVQNDVDVDEIITPRPPSASALSSHQLERPLHLKLVASTVVAILILCFVWQIVLFPTGWMMWATTGISIFCATFLWPAKPSTLSNETQMRLRTQELVAEGLPLKSRLMVAQTKAQQLEKRIKLLKKLQKMKQEFMACKQEEALITTVQVLLKSNRSPSTTHLNALSLSVLPVKLAAIDVKMQMPPVWALAQSRRGSRYILLNLFRELLSDKSALFRYPPLIKPKKQRTKASSKKKQTRSLVKAGSTPQRLDEI